MSQPAVNIIELDGALGVLPPSSGALFALIGPADSGPIDTPATFAKARDVISTFGGGPTVEQAAYYIGRYGRPVVFVRSGAAVPGAYLDEVEAEDGTVEDFDDSNVTGLSVITVASSPEPDGAYQVQVLFLIGGTVGVSGIVYQISLDGGSTWTFATALGVATSIDVGIGVTLNLTAATIIAGDYVTFSTTAPIEASAGELVHSGLQNAPTLDGATFPNDDYEVAILFVAGGVRGTPGVTYQWSLDGGRTYSPVTALGTDVSIIVPGSGGVKIDLGVGTIAAGASIAFPTVAPQWNDTELGTALDALKASGVTWELVHVVGPIDADAFDVLDLKVAGMATEGKYREWIGSTRLPVGDESEATYLASLTSAFSEKATVLGMLTAGSCWLTSGVSGRKYRRPISYPLAAREASVSQEINTADVNLGTLPGVSLRDSNGNAVHHDESVNPGLDDARFTVLRSWDGLAGVYVNRPRIFSAEGSDFRLFPHRRVINLAEAALRLYFIRRTSKPIRVDADTGFILEEDALEIEAGANAALRTVLLKKPKASGATFALSRTDNILSDPTMRGEARITPLAYPEVFEIEVGFLNPALQTQAA